MDRPTIDPAVERYLERLRSRLRGMPASEVDEILRELRGHVEERVQSGTPLREVLQALGDPESVAAEYQTERVTARAECARSPLAILHGLMLLRRGSLAGWTVLGLTALVYAWAFVLGGAAVEKLLSPRDVGIWVNESGPLWPRLTVDGPGPAGTREALGWWMVPFGMLACLTMVYAANQLGHWWIRRSRRRSEGR